MSAIKAERRLDRVQDDLTAAKADRSLLGQPEQRRAAPLPLPVRADRDQPKGVPTVVEPVDPDRAECFTVVPQQQRKIQLLEFVGVLRVIGLARKIPLEDRLAANGVI